MTKPDRKSSEHMELQTQQIATRLVIGEHRG